MNIDADVDVVDDVDVEDVNVDVDVDVDDVARYGGVRAGGRVRCEVCVLEVS